MRLTPQQTTGIIMAVAPFLIEHKAELRLYGSRVRDDLRGGDIDLLLLLKDADLILKLVENKHYLISAIKQYIGDQKIDLLITDHHALNHDAFLKMIFPESLILKRWE